MGCRKHCVMKRKRGKHGGVHARLRASPSRPALPSILPSTICSLDNKLDYIQLQETTQQEFRDYCVFVRNMAPSPGCRHSATLAHHISCRQKCSSVQKDSQWWLVCLHQLGMVQELCASFKLLLIAVRVYDCLMQTFLSTSRIHLCAHPAKQPQTITLPPPFLTVDVV